MNTSKKTGHCKSTPKMLDLLFKVAYFYPLRHAFTSALKSCICDLCIWVLGGAMHEQGVCKICFICVIPLRATETTYFTFKISSKIDSLSPGCWLVNTAFRSECKFAVNCKKRTRFKFGIRYPVDCKDNLQSISVSASLSTAVLPSL